MVYLEPAISLDGVPKVPTIVVGVDGSAASIVALPARCERGRRSLGDARGTRSGPCAIVGAAPEGGAT